MREYVLNIGEKEFRAEITEITTEYAKVKVNDTEYTVQLTKLGQGSGFTMPAARPATPVTAPPAPTTLGSAPAPHPTAPKSSSMAGDHSGAIRTPLPGLILEVLVREGDAVKAGQDLIIMEAMKMENRIQAPFDGTVKKIHVQHGSTIAEDDVLLEIARPAMTTL